MHGGWLHLGGNMLYLWIFGDNVEDRFGHAKFALFYLFFGIAATVAQVVVSAGSTIPNLGASGVIAGVLAAYIILFPRGQVKVLMGRGCGSYAGPGSDWAVDRVAIHQRNRVNHAISGDRRRSVHGSHRRLRRRVGSNLSISRQQVCGNGVMSAQAGGEDFSKIEQEK